MARALADKDTYMSFKGILAAAVVIASFVSAGVAQPAFATGSAPGTIDTSFGAGGKVLTNLGPGANGQQIQRVTSDAVLQSNGDIVVSGTFGLVRYLPSGTLDTSFGAGGRVTLNFGGRFESLRSVALQADGKIVVAGGSVNGLFNDFAVARFNSNGTLDTSFGTGGKVLTDFGVSAQAESVAVQQDGKIVVSGVCQHRRRRQH